jgi:DNA-binding XRE family transcriptional regulator
MPNVASVLKQEIARIARKEIKSAAAPVRRASVRARRDLADLKRRLALLEKANHELQGHVARLRAAQPAMPETGRRARLTAKGLRSLRRKLGLSQTDMGRLIRISGQAVAHLEQQQGALKVRNATRAALLAVRGLGAREARKQLAALAAQKPARRARARRR